MPFCFLLNHSSTIYGSERLGCSTMVDVVTNEPISILAGLSRCPHQSKIYKILFGQGLYRMFFAFESCLWKLAAMKISRIYKTSITVGGKSVPPEQLPPCLTVRVSEMSSGPPKVSSCYIAAFPYRWSLLRVRLWVSLQT